VTFTLRSLIGLMMEVLNASETYVSFYGTTWRNSSEDSRLQTLQPQIYTGQQQQ
jgi:hypothetical protein